MRKIVFVIVIISILLVGVPLVLTVLGINPLIYIFSSFEKNQYKTNQSHSASNFGGQKISDEKIPAILEKNRKDFMRSTDYSTTSTIQKSETSQKPLPTPTENTTSNYDINTTDTKSVNALIDSMSIKDQFVFYGMQDRIVANWPRYKDVADELKKEILKEYNFSDSKGIETAIAESKRLMREFWEGGDLLNRDNYKRVYKARAILELILANDPQNEKIYFELENVIMSYCPIYPGTGISDKERETFYQNGQELGLIEKRHFDDIIEKKAFKDVSLEDLCVIYNCVWRPQILTKTDLINLEPKIKKIMELEGKIPKEEMKRRLLEDKELMEKVRKVVNEYQKGTIKNKTEMIEWALAASKYNKWLYYKNGFTIWEKRIGRIGHPELNFRIFAIPTDWSSKADVYRFSRREEGFYGPDERKKLLRPMSLNHPDGKIPGSDLYESKNIWDLIAEKFDALF